MKIKSIPVFIITMLLALPAVSFAVDACTQTWEVGSSMTYGRYRTQGAVVDDIFYVFGGMDGDFTYFYAVEAYDYWTDTWTNCADMPHAVSNHCVATWDGIIYVAGGYDFDFRNYFSAYDPSTDTWDTSLSQLPVGIGGASCSALDGKVYVAGGNDGASDTNALNIYDITTDTWSVGAAMPAAVAYGHGAMVNDDFVVAGGWPNLTDTYIYDIATNNWTTSTQMLLGRQSGAIANVHTPSGTDYFYIIGGGDLGDCWTATNDLQQFQTSWLLLLQDSMPADRFGQAGGNIGGAILFSAGGGSAFGEPEANLYIYNQCFCHIHSANPALAPAGVATVIDFVGIHFDDTTGFWLDDGTKTTYPLTDVSITTSTVAQATIPTNAPAGPYELWANNTLSSSPKFYGMIEFELCDCVIDDVCYNEGDTNPSNVCAICDPATSAVLWSNNDGETCDDGLWCTINDVCASGVCEGPARDCNDGEFCTGVETCNEDTATCDSPGDPCGVGEVCNEGADACDSSNDDDVDDDDDDDDDDDEEGSCCGC